MQNRNKNVFFRFPNEFNLVQVSAAEMWNLFSEDLRNALSEHAQRKHRCPDNEYINLQFKVKYLWNHYVAGLESFQNVIPGYSK